MKRKRTRESPEFVCIVCKKRYTTLKGLHRHLAAEVYGQLELDLFSRESAVKESKPLS